MHGYFGDVAAVVVTAMKVRQMDRRAYVLLLQGMRIPTYFHYIDVHDVRPNCSNSSCAAALYNK